MKKAALWALVGVVTVLAADCIVSYPTFGPPPLREEAIIVAPGPGFIWVGGYWRWSGGNYSWVSGHWARARAGSRWEAGRWERRGHRWVWRKGRWR
jgi:hypothetical protein